MNFTCAKKLRNPKKIRDTLVYILGVKSNGCFSMPEITESLNAFTDDINPFKGLINNFKNNCLAT